MQLDPWREELVDALRLLQQRRFEEIDVSRMLERAEWCFGEGEMLYCLIFLKIARLVQRSEAVATSSASP